MEEMPVLSQIFSALRRLEESERGDEDLKRFKEELYRIAEEGER